jgi:hypothetical protein
MIRKYSLLISRALAAITLLLLGPVFSASQGLGIPTIEELARASDVVMVGRVIKSHTRWVGRKIVTTSTVEPLRNGIFKGHDPNRGKIEVACLGGTLGAISQQVTHEATLQVGEIAVIFLVEPRTGAAWHIRGWRIINEWGKIAILRPGEPESRLENNPHLKLRLEDIKNRVKGVTP